MTVRSNQNVQKTDDYVAF